MNSGWSAFDGAARFAFQAQEGAAVVVYAQDPEAGQGLAETYTGSPGALLSVRLIFPGGERNRGIGDAEVESANLCRELVASFVGAAISFSQRHGGTEENVEHRNIERRIQNEGVTGQ
ncbi:MAG: hypothetical protein K9N49_10900 [Candidatus Marinimicrobia bacterium]|nr:hypothetical protein [Candidatus Neomarinimicrobiota bacterium]